jgi:hypothetical protein
MLNWSLLTPRNIAVIAVLGIATVFIFNHFSKKGIAE